ncbi:hypothetical protein PSTG_01663 [Puccinia striiformis f. sp. tritici PST-78]|uniref:Uncharacterized protein n=1 Tax=Puccinia striiformis f. sp. tritici PST-78 TaxID=1165861 RepID=A0A0L0W0J3_9BASI|nr:hypothetical protein PSTG_01663 [Puccinia striiformis f. sp. tritici PST-78]
MADLQKQYEELMKLVTEERALQKKAEEALAVAKQATELAAATAADNIAKANAFAAQVSAAAIQKGPISSVDPEEQRPNAGSTKSGCTWLLVHTSSRMTILRFCGCCPTSTAKHSNGPLPLGEEG